MNHEKASMLLNRIMENMGWLGPSTPVADCIPILKMLGCSHDLVWDPGVNVIACLMNVRQTTPARDIKLSYMGRTAREGKERRVYGSLSGMIMDRRRDFLWNLPESGEIKAEPQNEKLKAERKFLVALLRSHDSMADFEKIGKILQFYNSMSDKEVEDMLGKSLTKFGGKTDGD